IASAPRQTGGKYRAVDAEKTGPPVGSRHARILVILARHLSGASFVREIILIQVSGGDRPGLTAAFTRILAQHQLNILDIGQAVIHDSLSLGILIEVPPRRETSSVLKDLLFEAHKLNISVRFRPIDHDRYEEWVAGQGKDRYIITLLSRKITAVQLSDVTAVVASNELNIESITRLSGRVHLEDEEIDEDARACIEISVRGEDRKS